LREEQITLSETEQLMLYRIVQEALNNVAKHAKANSVEVLIIKVGDELMIRVVDDGCGIGGSSNLGRTRGGDNMRYRARLIGAQLTWLQATGQTGTVVEIRVPLSDGSSS
jgi:two-component system sensor histidine kinase UhpB